MWRRRNHHPTRPTLRFAQVSDSHIGFTGAANPDVAGSFGAPSTSSTTWVTRPTSSSTPAISPIWPPPSNSTR